MGTTALKTVMQDTYAWASAYPIFWIQHFYGIAFANLYGARIEGESDFRRHLLSYPYLPEVMLARVKDHPRSLPEDTLGISEMLREIPNSQFVPRGASLPALLRECSAVAGANSTVMYEARLLHRKPVYAYARSWFTNHEELFTPLRLDERNELPRFDRVEDSRLMQNERLDAYADWFLAQLLARQIRRGAETRPTALRGCHALC